MKHIVITSLIIISLCLTAQAYDPDAPPPEYYGERETVGGSKWTGGDTFLVITLPLVVAAILLLPHIFDGEYREWPLHRFATFHQLVKTPLLVNKFPTRRLCESY